MNCTHLKSFEIPSSIVRITNSAFSGCTGITSFDIPNSVVEIGNGAFQSCTGITSFVIPESVTTIGDNAFKSCSELKSIEIPESVTEIGKYAFYGCKNLKSVSLPSSLEKIGSGAFQECYDLTTLEIPQNVKKIESTAFGWCKGLTSIVIPNSVISIGNQAFRDCTSLKSVVIGNSVISIGSRVFNGCSSLKTITSLNTTPPNISSDTFTSDAKKTCQLTVPDDAESLYREDTYWKDFQFIDGDGDYAYDFEADGICFKIKSEDAATCEVTYRDKNYNSYSGNVVIPAYIDHDGKTYSVTSIGIYAFADCTGMTSVEIPNTVITIAPYAFAGCTGLAEIVSLYVDAPSIAVNTFKDVDKSACVLKTPSKGLYKYRADKNWKTFTKTEAYIYCDFEWDGMCYNILSESDLTCEVTYRTFVGLDNKHESPYTGEVVVPTTAKYNGKTFTVTKIGSNAFSDCAELKSVAIPNQVVEIGTNPFISCDALQAIHFTDDSNFCMENECIMSKDGTLIAALNRSEITIPDGVATIGSSAFQNCTALESVSIPEGVGIINLYAFKGCNQLKAIDIPNSVTEIGSNTFDDCVALETARLSDALEAIEENLFYNCTSLKEIVIPHGVTTIKSGTFHDCRALASVAIPNTVTTIGNGVFMWCSSLEEIEIPESVTEIGNSTFNFTGLKSIVIPNSVTTFGNNMFMNCEKLESAKLPDSLDKICRYMFSACRSLVSIELPATVTSIGTGAFSGCSQLMEIVSWNTTPPSVESFNTFSSVSKKECVVRVPAEAVDAYKEAAYWEEFFNIIDMDAKTGITLDIAMTEGWNWLSFCMEDNGIDYYVGQLGNNMERMLSQTKEVVRDPQYGLVGNMTEIDATSAYKVKSSAAFTLTIKGKAVDAATTEVALADGWNWIGYTAGQEQQLGDALANLHADKGDCIQSQDAFAIYDGEQWEGNLDALKPGYGYMYKSNGTKTFCYADGGASPARSRKTSAAAGDNAEWSVAPVGKYHSQMSVVAKLEGLDVADCTVGAFDDKGECRGTGVRVGGLLFVSVAGNGNEEIHFAAIDRNSHEELPLSGTLTFTADIIGTLSVPYTLAPLNATAINPLHSATAPEGIHDLAGRRVATANRRGIYINNGKKIAVAGN